MKTYIVWNPSKVSSYGNPECELEVNTYEGLKSAEAFSNGSISSEVHTDDIDNFIDAVYNETDTQLCYILKPVIVSIELDIADWQEVLHCLECVDGEQLERIEKVIKNALPE